MCIAEILKESGVGKLFSSQHLKSRAEKIDSIVIAQQLKPKT